MRPGFLARWRASREHCAFVDVVVGREVWVWRTEDGREWLGFSRFSMWMQRPSSLSTC